jgi:hypothetical protein
LYTKHIQLIALCGALLYGHPAMADAVNPEEEACAERSAGASCDASGGAGTCETGECCRNDYSNGTPPTTVCGPCLVCKPDPDSCATASASALGAGSVIGGLGCLVALGALRRKKRRA